MTIEFYNLNEKELRDLRELEDKSPNEVMLKITKKAFDGYEMAQMLIDTVGIIVSIIGMIVQWKESRSCDDNGNAAKSVRIVVNHPDGKKYSIELENASQESLNAAFTIMNKEE